MVATPAPTNGHTSNGQAAAKKEPAWRFRNPTTPARVAHLFARKELSRLDLLLCWVIDSLVTPQTDTQNGLGCYASNARLGEYVAHHEIRVAQSIGKMQKMGLLVVVEAGGRRYLEMQWSRIAEERHAVRGEYGKALRLATAELEKGLWGAGPVCEGGVSGNAKGGLAETLNGRVSGNANHIDSKGLDHVRSDERPTDAPAQREPTGRNGHTTNGESALPAALAQRMAGNGTPNCKHDSQHSNGTASTSAPAERPAAKCLQSTPPPLRKLALRMRHLAEVATDTTIHWTDSKHARWGERMGKVVKLLNHDHARLRGILDWLEKSLADPAFPLRPANPDHLYNCVHRIERRMNAQRYENRRRNEEETEEAW